MCFNVFIICNHEKGISMEIGSSEGGGGEERWSGDGGEKKGKKSVCVRFIVSLLTVFL